MILRSRRVVTPSGVRAATIHVRGEKIERVGEFGFLDNLGLEAAMRELRDTNAPLLVHAELPQFIGTAKGASYRAYLQSRPSEAEDAAIDLVYQTAKRTHARAHVVHLSSAAALEILLRARDHRIPLTAETTPHYLHFEAEKIPDGAPQFKCAPPIREHANRE